MAGWFNKFKDEFLTNWKKEWSVSDTQTVTNGTSNIINTISTDAGAVADTAVTSLTSRALTAIAAEFETAITELETFIGSKDSYIESFVAAEIETLKAKAEAEFNKLIVNKKFSISALETELMQAKNWLTSKFGTILSKI